MGRCKRPLACWTDPEASGDTEDGCLIIRRHSHGLGGRPSRLLDVDNLKREREVDNPWFFEFSKISDCESAPRVNRCWFALELAMDEQAARAASEGRVSGP